MVYNSFATHTKRLISVMFSLYYNGVGVSTKLSSDFRTFYQRVPLDSFIISWRTTLILKAKFISKNLNEYILKYAFNY